MQPEGKEGINLIKNKTGRKPRKKIFGQNMCNMLPIL